MDGCPGGVARRENPGVARAEEDERTQVESAYWLEFKPATPPLKEAPNLVLCPRRRVTMLI